MAATEYWHYRGYDISPQRQWPSWCVGIYPTPADLPLFATIHAAKLSVAKAGCVGRGDANNRPRVLSRHTIDRVLSRHTSYGKRA